MRSNIVADNWYENFFKGINCELWEKVVAPEWTTAEVNFLIEVLRIKPGGRALDIPCGTGRHAIELARKGFRVTGVDLSEEFVRKLQEKVTAENLDIDVKHGNILTADLQGSFDGAYCMGNSFGYFDWAGMKTFVTKVSDSLKSGGRFVINSGMVAESILPGIPKGETYYVDDITMEISNAYLMEEGCLVSHLHYTRNGISEDHSYKHYVFTLSEIERLLAAVNMKTVDIYNSTDKRPYQLGDGQLYLVAEKR